MGIWVALFVDESTGASGWLAGDVGDFLLGGTTRLMATAGGAFLVFLGGATGGSAFATVAMGGAGSTGLAVAGTALAAGVGTVTTTTGLVGAGLGVSVLALLPVKGSICQKLLSVIVSVLQPVRASNPRISNLRLIACTGEFLLCKNLQGGHQGRACLGVKLCGHEKAGVAWGIHLFHDVDLLGTWSFVVAQGAAHAFDH